MQGFQYRSDTYGEHDPDEWGKEGWECFAITGGTWHYKRPLNIVPTPTVLIAPDSVKVNVPKPWGELSDSQRRDILNDVATALPKGGTVYVQPKRTFQEILAATQYKGQSRRIAAGDMLASSAGPVVAIGIDPAKPGGDTTAVAVTKPEPAKRDHARVRLTFYKPSGKYYSDAIYTSELPIDADMYQYRDEVKALRLTKDKRTGLSSGGTGFYCTIDVLDGDKAYPMMLSPEGVTDAVSILKRLLPAMLTVNEHSKNWDSVKEAQAWLSENE